MYFIVYCFFFNAKQLSSLKLYYNSTKITKEHANSFSIDQNVASHNWQCINFLASLCWSSKPFEILHRRGRVTGRVW